MKLSRGFLACLAINEAQASWENCPSVDTSEWQNLHPDGLDCSESVCALRCADGYQPTAPLKAKCQQIDGEWEWNKTSLGKCIGCKDTTSTDPFVARSCKLNAKGQRVCEFTCPAGMDFNGKAGKTGTKLKCKCNKSGKCKWRNASNKKVTNATITAYKCTGDSPVTTQAPPATTTKEPDVTDAPATEAPPTDGPPATNGTPATIPPTEDLPNYNNDNYTFTCSGDVCTLKLSDGQTFVGKQDGDIVSFKGIPYAKPPTGNRRFASPKLITKYTTTVNAKKIGPACIQFPEGNFRSLDQVREEEEQSEDCLTINITVPKSAIKNKQKVPISFFIHGGNNQQGSNAGGNFDGLVSNGIMSVSVNYRLGGLGFFHLKQAETEGGLRGNWGVQDQLAGLKWISMYGGAFGGDHNSVCIDGCSAGSVNGWFHLTNPASWPYFHRIVLAGIGAGGIAEYEGRATDNMYDMVLAEAGKSDLAGLRSLTVSKLKNKMVAAQDKWLQQNLAANQAGKPTNSMPENLEFYAPRQYFFTNIVGDNFLHDQSMYLVRKGQIRPNTPVAWSYAKDDGYTFAPAVYADYAQGLIPKLTNQIMNAQESTGHQAPASFQDKWFSVAYPNHATELKSAFGCKNTSSDCFDKWARWVQAVVWDCPTRWAFSGAIKDNPSQYGAIYPQQFREGTCFNGQKTCHCSEVSYIHGEVNDGGFGSRLGAAWMKFFKTGEFDSADIKSWQEMNYNKFNQVSSSSWTQDAVKQWKECDVLDKLQAENNHYSFGKVLNTD